MVFEAPWGSQEWTSDTSNHDLKSQFTFDKFHQTFPLTAKNSLFTTESVNLCLKLLPKPRIKELPGIAPRAFTGLYEIIEQNKSKFDTKESGAYL